MEQIAITLPSADEVEYSLSVVAEEFGPDFEDEATNAQVTNRWQNYDIWAWASVGIYAVWKNQKGRDYLGGCSYESEQDFIENSGYYADMKQRAYEDLISQLKLLAD